jgi:glycosyltransferase involved in cell wall biosynthesis
MSEASVVIPTRDRPELLELTLQSVLAQRGVDLEVIIVDDGAGTGTALLVEQVGDLRVQRLVNKGASGVSRARNLGIEAARAEWIAFCDDDDLWAPEKLKAQIASAAACSRGWVYAGDVTVDDELRVRAGSPPPPPLEVVTALRKHNAVPAGASNVMVRRDVLETAGHFDPELRTSEDWDLWLRLAATGLPACVERPLVALRTHSAMASRNLELMLADVETIAQRHAIPVDRARHERWAAWVCLEDGRQGAAARHYLRAVRQGDLRSAARAAVALLAPAAALRRAEPRTDAWAREAQMWLDVLRDRLSSSGAGNSRAPR